MISDEYKGMNYLPTGYLLAQFNTKSKLLCAAQCARLYPTCNIAVFDKMCKKESLMFNF